jgi:hypothetical protein
VDGVGVANFIHDQIPLAVIDRNHKSLTVEPKLLASLKLPNLYG